jgi:hypothetical protein
MQRTGGNGKKTNKIKVDDKENIFLFTNDR